MAAADEGGVGKRRRNKRQVIQDVDIPRHEWRDPLEPPTRDPSESRDPCGERVLEAVDPSLPPTEKGEKRKRKEKSSWVGRRTSDGQSEMTRTATGGWGGKDWRVEKRMEKEVEGEVEAVEEYERRGSTTMM